MENLELLVISQRVAAFDQAVKPHQAKLPYHNEQHGQESSLDAMQQVEWCRQNGLDINPLPLFYGMRGHDLGIDDDFLILGFEKAEPYAADLTAKTMQKLGFDNETEINPTIDIIKITNPQLTPKTVEHKIARRADIANVGGDFVPFVARSGLLWQERIMVTGNRIGYGEWAVQSCDFLNNMVLAPDLSLGDFDRGPDGLAFFQSKAKANVANLGGMLTTIAEIFESAPVPTEDLPCPDYETLLVQQGIG